MSKYSDITSQVNPSKLESKSKNRDHNKKNKRQNFVKYTQVGISFQNTKANVFLTCRPDMNIWLIFKWIFCLLSREFGLLLQMRKHTTLQLRQPRWHSFGGIALHIGPIGCKNDQKLNHAKPIISKQFLLRLFNQLLFLLNISMS